MVSFFNANYDRLVINLNLIHDLMAVLKGIIERTTCYDCNIVSHPAYFKS